MKIYEQSEREKEHYRRILSAKSSIPAKERRRSLCFRSDPMKQFQLRNMNNKLVGKLKEIYDGHPAYETFDQRLHITRDGKGKGSRKSSLVNEYKKREYQSIIDHNNLKLVDRIMTAKSTLGNWREREKKLRSYSKITSKSFNSPYKSKEDSSFFEQFKKEMIRSSNRNADTGGGEKKKRKRKRRTLVPASQK